MLKFLEPFDRDIQKSLLEQIRDLWTHTSTAIEGNTLSLGDTHFVLSEGLTVSGKPLKDHQEVVGHAKAIDLIYEMVGREIHQDDIYALHKAVQTEVVHDIYKPYGSWKVEPNGCYIIDNEGQQQYIEFARPADVPQLMQELIAFINLSGSKEITTDNAHETYAKIHMGFVHIHPFWDGNGRIARLIANLPLLGAGLPPIVIQRTDRKKYIDTLSEYQLKCGQLGVDTGVWPNEAELKIFNQFCLASYSAVKQIIDKAKLLQDSRNQSR